MRGLVLSTLIILVQVSAALAQIPQTEREALIAIYNGTNGDGWTNNSNWKVAPLHTDGFSMPGTECTWMGVGCGVSNVIQLVFNSNNLVGSLPPEIGNLPMVYLVSMHHNDLSGELPSEIADLSFLSKIDLSNNEIGGPIPTGLGNLPNLQWLVLYNNQFTGGIPPELGNIATLTYIQIMGNQLGGTIPPELGDLPNLAQLAVSNNGLTGPIPPELGDLATLTSLNLGLNELSGPIPSELGGLPNLLFLELNNNRLSGPIPPQLGDLGSLQTLYLYSNKLNGEIPGELSNLSSLVNNSGLRIAFNALHTDDVGLAAFLNTKHQPGQWQSTQTIAPVNLGFERVGDHTIWLTWDMVSYLDEPGGYSVFSTLSGTGEWVTGGWTEDKFTVTYPVTGLEPGTAYDLAASTFTDPHTANQNLVNSDFSSIVVATTASTGCARPVISAAWSGGPVTLLVPGTYDSYLWNTDETTPTIEVNPSSEEWYWVTVTTPGPCEETAARSVAGTAALVFADHFESGDTSGW